VGPPAAAAPALAATGISLSCSSISDCMATLNVRLRLELSNVAETVTGSSAARPVSGAVVCAMTRGGTTPACKVQLRGQTATT
jgi:hypothetical protein